jgi:hypothetical protein
MWPLLTDSESRLDVLRVKSGSFPFGEHMILHLYFQKKWAIFEMEIYNSNYGRTKNDDINGWNWHQLAYI